LAFAMFAQAVVPSHLEMSYRQALATKLGTPSELQGRRRNHCIPQLRVDCKRFDRSGAVEKVKPMGTCHGLKSNTLNDQRIAAVLDEPMAKMKPKIAMEARYRQHEGVPLCYLEVTAAIDQGNDGWGVACNSTNHVAVNSAINVMGQEATPTVADLPAVVGDECDSYADSMSPETPSDSEDEAVAYPDKVPPLITLSHRQWQTQEELMLLLLGCTGIYSKGNVADAYYSGTDTKGDGGVDRGSSMLPRRTVSIDNCHNRCLGEDIPTRRSYVPTMERQYGCTKSNWIMREPRRQLEQSGLPPNWQPRNQRPSLRVKCGSLIMGLLASCCQFDGVCQSWHAKHLPVMS